MTKAEEFIKNNNLDITKLMTALDDDYDIKSEQDYENGITTWFFEDKSFIKIQGMDVETGIN